MGIVEGEFRDPDRVLVIQDAEIKIDRSTRRFSISVPLTRQVTSFQLQAIDIFGRLEAETFVIKTAAWEDVVRGARARANQEPLRFGMGVGVSSLAYQQDRVANYSELALTGKLSAQYRLAPEWDVMLSGYFTALPLSSSRNDTSVRFLGLNLRAGYSLPFVQAPWRLSILGGGYFATMFVSNELFGYQGVMGPQIYPSIQRELSSGSILTAYAKYSPVSQGGSLIDLKSREWAIGAGWINPLKDGRQFSINVDIADLLVIGSTTSARSQSFTVGVGYGW